MKYQAILNEKEAMVAVTQNGDALRYVKDPSEAVVMAAVTQNGHALQYVLDYDMFMRVANALGIPVEV